MFDFKEFRRLNNITQVDAASYFGCTQGFISQIEKGTRPIPEEFLKKILANTQWDISSLVSQDETSKSEPTIAEKNTDFRLVPMYNLDARGGFGDNDEVDVAEYVVDHIPFKNADVTDICVPISGNSMAPTYCAGSIVLLHRVEQWADFLELGQVYMIVLKDGRRLIKELRASQEDRNSKYLCVSHNPTFDPVELPKDMISRVFLVRAVYAKTAM